MLSTNCYLIQDKGKCAILDPGGDFGLVRKFITENRLEPTLVLATHGHFDHVFSAGDFYREYGLRLNISAGDIDTMNGAAGMSYDFTGEKMDTDFETMTFANGREFRLGDSIIRAIIYPGHTPGSTVFETGDIMFTGDMVFRGTIGRVDFGGSMEEMKRSLIKFRKTGGSYVLLPGHGESTTLDREKADNPYLSDAFLDVH